MVVPGSAYRLFLIYFVPLALQSMAQSLTYPLVAMVASRGLGGPVNMAGLAQAHGVFGVLWTLSMGLLTAGMVFGRSREGFARCRRINNGLTLAMVFISLCLMMPPVAHRLFHALLGLPPSIERPATLAFIASLPLNVLFFLRTPYQILLFTHNATAKAFLASLARIVLTLLLSPLFCWLHAVGPVWATVCMTIGVLLELYLTRRFARPFLKQLPEEGPPPRYTEILVFALILSVGALFLSLSGFLMGAFIARAPDPEQVLPVFYLVLGVANPVAGGAMRIQALTLTYYGRSQRANQQLVRFTGWTGLVLGVLPLLLLVPGLKEWYYITLQKLSAADMPLVRAASWVLVLFPLTAAWRAYSEGQAAWLKKPIIVLAGQAVYLSVAVVAAFFALHLGMSGHLLGAFALALANAAAAAMVLFAIRWERRDDLPPPAPG